MTEQRQRYLKAKVALALYSEFGHVPKEAEIDRVYHLTRVLYTAVLGTHYLRKQQKKRGQLLLGELDGHSAKQQLQAPPLTSVSASTRSAVATAR